MRRFWLSWILTGLVGICLIGYVSCGGPIQYRVKTNNTSTAGNPMTSEAPRLLAALCGVVSRCSAGVTSSLCETAVLTSGAIDYQLGLPTGGYPIYDMVVQAERSGSIKADVAASTTCTNQINALTCDNPVVQGAYDPQASNPFTGLARMVPTGSGSCTDIYRPKIKAFPSAEGFGQGSQGGRGGRIIRVTNLNDSGPGSLREALTATGPRIVVFDVSGTIDLTSHIDINGEASSYLTVAGQTSPGGIQTAGPNGRIWVRDGVHDVIFRHLRLRPGSPVTPENTGGALFVYSAGAPAYNVIFDHCSVEWANGGSGVYSNARDVTFQWNIFANDLISPNGYGVTVDGYAPDPNTVTVTFHHNLLANNPAYVPSMYHTGVGDFRNNLIYNSGAAIWGTTFQNRSAFGNQINNHYLAGPTDPSVHFYFSNAGPIRSDGLAADRGGTRVYTEGNWSPNCPSGCADDWSNGYVRADESEMGTGVESPALASDYRALMPFAAASVATDPTGAVKAKVLAAAGATKPLRDALDVSVVNDVLNFTGAFATVEGTRPTLTGGSPPADTDQDGIADAWETAHGLNPSDAGDGPRTSANGYTNVENYLNELAGDTVP